MSMIDLIAQTDYPWDMEYDLVSIGKTGKTPHERSMLQYAVERAVSSRIMHRVLVG